MLTADVVCLVANLGYAPWFVSGQRNYNVGENKTVPYILEAKIRPLGADPIKEHFFYSLSFETLIFNFTNFVQERILDARADCVS